jgi:hypothetical protein
MRRRGGSSESSEVFDRAEWERLMLVPAMELLAAGVPNRGRRSLLTLVRAPRASKLPPPVGFVALVLPVWPNEPSGSAPRPAPVERPLGLVRGLVIWIGLN